ncbi:hypothetical protein HDZ31DRAFT_34603 [Schizophyllum fasciatum]
MEDRRSERLRAECEILSKSSKSTLVASVLKRDDFMHECAEGVSRVTAAQTHMQTQVKILTDRVAALEAALLRVTAQCEQAAGNARTAESALSAQRMYAENLATAVSRLEGGQARLEGEFTRLRRAREYDEEEAEIERTHARAASIRARSAQEARMAAEIDARLQETEDLLLDEFEDLHGVLGPKLGYRRCAHPPADGKVVYARPRTPTTPRQQPTPASTPVRAHIVPPTPTSGSVIRSREERESVPHGDGSSTASNASSRYSSSSSEDSTRHSARSVSRRPHSRDSPRRSRTTSIAPPTPSTARSNQENRYPDLATPKQVNFAAPSRVRATAPAGMPSSYSGVERVQRPYTYAAGNRDSTGSSVNLSISDESEESMDERQRRARAALLRASGASTYTAGPKTPKEVEEATLATKQADRARART